jgi:hypothetical protein
MLQRKDEAARARHGSDERRRRASRSPKGEYLRGIGEPTDVPKRTPARGPPYWASRVLRRGAGSVEAAEYGGRSALVKAALRPHAAWCGSATCVVARMVAQLKDNAPR